MNNQYPLNPKRKKEVGVLIINSSIQISPHEERQVNKEEIKRSLIGSLANEILDKDLVEIREEFSPGGIYKTYRGYLRVPDKKSNRIVIDDDRFFYNGKPWDDKEIERALKNTYPQHFI